MLNPKSVGDGKLRITVAFNYGDYSAEGYLEISLAEKLNAVADVKYIAGSDEQPSSSATFYYTDKCSVCGGAHYGSESGYVLFSFERPNEEPTAFDIDNNWDDGSSSGFSASMSMSGMQTYDKYGCQNKAPISITPHGKDLIQVKVDLNYFQDGPRVSKKLCDVDWRKQDPEYVEGNLNGTMAVTSFAQINSEDLIDIHLNSVGQACWQTSSSQKIDYSIKDGEDVISIDEHGSVYAKMPGTATIAATDSLGKIHTGTIKVIALPSEKPSIKFLKTNEITIPNSLDFMDGYMTDNVLDCSRRDLYGTLMTDDAVALLKSYPHFEYYHFVSRDLDIARTDEGAFDQATAGIILSPVGLGTAKIDVYLGDPEKGGLLCDTLTVHVVDPGEEPAKTTVSIADGYSVSMNKGTTQQLKAKVSPDDKAGQIVWSSSDESVLTVDVNGFVTAVGDGAASITATVDGISATTDVITVVQPATGLTLDKRKVTLVGAATEQLKATVVPAEADQTVIWKSSNEGVVTVDQAGTVTAVSKGVATITASTEDGSFSQDCMVTVSNPATSLALDRNVLTLKKGEEGAVKASLAGALPGEVDAIDFVLDGSDASGAFSVVDNGDGSYGVTALKTGSGSFVIAAGSFSQTVTVTVTNPAQKVELNKTSLSFTVGDVSEKLTAKVSPSDADDTTVAWTSSDPSAVTVKDGVVTPLKAGVATITATCGDKTATCTVNVAERVIAGVAGSDGTDVKVSAENNVAAELVRNGSISLMVEEPTALSDAAKATIAGLEQGSTKVAETLDIKLLKNGEVIEDYDGSASFVVRVKMTAAMKALANIKVLYVGEDGATEAMDTWVEGDYLCFRTTHFSTYVVTGDQPAQPAGPSQPTQPTQATVTTTKTTKVAKKGSHDALANTGDRAMAASAVAAMAGLTLLAAMALRKRFDI